MNPDPKVMMEMSELIQQLPPATLQRLQTLMHNAMAGFDVRKEMEEFERELPPDFRDRLMTLFGASGMGASVAGLAPQPQSQSQPEVSEEMDVREARMTILRAVAEGKMTPETAEGLLFHG